MMVSKLIDNYRINKRKKATILSKKKWYGQGQIPWQEGYIYVKEELIRNYILNQEITEYIEKRALPPEYGFRIDERIVEYPWILTSLSDQSGRLLDAGSTFNFDYILDHPKLRKKELSIYTYYPEPSCFFSKRVSYQFGDLRDIPYKDNYFDEVVCQSTLEHIDMDNSMYGYELATAKSQKSYEYLKVITELERVLRPGGLLLLTFPYGCFENHGFFQQFDVEMVFTIEKYLGARGKIDKQFFKYEEQGWVPALQAGCDLMESFNPHTGKGKKSDYAAHSRAICCVKFIKAK